MEYTNPPSASTATGLKGGKAAARDACAAVDGDRVPSQQVHPPRIGARRRGRVERRRLGRGGVARRRRRAAGGAGRGHVRVPALLLVRDPHKLLEVVGVAALDGPLRRVGGQLRKVLRHVGHIAASRRPCERPHLVLVPVGHRHALAPVREGLVRRLAIAAHKDLELYADRVVAEPVLVLAGGAAAVLRQPPKLGELRLCHCCPGAGSGRAAQGGGGEGDGA